MTAPLHGLLGEFAEPRALLEAARLARAAGYRRLDAHAPFPVPGLGDAVEPGPDGVALWTLAGGALGGLGGYFMEWWSATRGFPLDVGGRPLHSAPAFIPLSFELTILLGGLAAAAAFFRRSGLPRPHHPLFGVSAFARATQDRFFLEIEAADPLFDARATRRFLEEAGAREVHDVPR